ncbi:uncharacterized protein OCT59_000800 [Rhizophagus irregularis]|uniref:Uncharacterized protein n=2 Tax=Rhizophagus irregularis TaxID=588596 RepID=U9SPI0_RHIID|nr:hypothetical protein GLOIN_2v1787828 [Rhizophagus irregularis DAOM 181602=DAOM 197198]EXX75330.1 hypothetical protein RirG_042700 [Rhizophagus irregularis DAOM 197198w]UZN99533.1 hypothetical protein OCT59_000800 [Rhizophagus irregularis]POG60474.1 hypothetical protein GLOIN_2v1787828 [Rhizophagus irregularis DAOM 181602=DAOM 197198]CAG8760160.1 3872_t:CDS:1 [Rhizophagus irregularis]GBC13400.1 hypothetical protein GLOIN_2v1787828 [Rhizophagus irregularis DAOM 181602=DAOM 197198]|eukprot:XP_025167340.1 hypothetical protein GLOIN_2v1787828 [Rhizophagus irregularis DAOM 181602=DAOM 197198]
MPPFSPADYDHIMQCAEKKPRDKVLKDLTDKYCTSQKRIYQIWKGEEKNGVVWNQPIHMSTAAPGETVSLSNINVVGGRTKSEIQDQDVSPFTELEKQIHDAKIESSKSIDSLLEEGEKAKKAEGKKSKSKDGIPPLIPSPIQSQPILTLYEKIVERNIKNIANMKNILEK